MGFTVTWHGIVDHPTGKVEAALIYLGSCIIELVVPVDLSRVTSTAGPVQHIALTVTDIEKTIAELTAKGIDFKNEGLEYMPTFYKGIKHAFLYGPSNERIELAEEIG